MTDPPYKEIEEYLKQRGIVTDTTTIYNWDLNDEGKLTLWVDGIFEIPEWGKDKK